MDELEDTMHAVEPHVQEMRRRLLHVIVFFLAGTGAMFYFSADILAWLQNDLALGLNALTAYEVIYTRLILAAIFGFLLILPVTTYHLLRFLKPGLKPKEYVVLRNFLPLFLLLFFGGSVFAYQFIVKASLQFFQQTTVSADVTAVWGLKDTILFVIKISSLTGILFQLPIIAAVLSKAGFITAAQMKANRAYFAVAILVIAALATPPDIITQILITVPILALYQLSIILVARMERQALL